VRYFDGGQTLEKAYASGGLATVFQEKREPYNEKRRSLVLAPLLYRLEKPFMRTEYCPACEGKKI